MKNNKYHLITSVTFMAFLVLPTVAWLIIGLIPKAHESLTVNIGENRAPHQISEEVSLTDITQELELYYSDRVPFRNTLILADQKINGFIEKDYEEKIQPLLVKCFYKKAKGNNTLELYPIGGESDISQTQQVKDETESKPVQSSIEDKNQEFTEVERVEPTCSEDGYVRYFCEETGEEYTDIIPAMGHDEIVIEQQEASYTAYGHKIYQCQTCGKKRWGDFTAKLLDDSPFPTTIYGNGYVMRGRYDWLFFLGNRSLKYYKGECILTEEEMQEILDKMQTLQTLCDEKGITLVFMVLPNKSQVYSEYIPTKHYTPDSTEKRLPLLKQYIDEHSDITFLYPIEELKAGKMYYDTYFAQDTHWNNVGAFFGTMALYAALGKETTDIADLKAEPYTDVMNALFGTGNIDPTGFKKDIDYILDYKPEVNVTYREGKSNIKGYDTFHKTRSDASDQRNFVLFGDSFRIGMIQYIQKDFASCTFAQRNSSTKSKEEIRNADVLVISSVERFDRELFEFIDTVIRYLKD